MRNSFSCRVNLAANYISQGRNITRSFDSCFENYDGDAVVIALARRVIKSPDGKLAKNIWNYLSKDSVMPLVEKYADLSRSGLNELSQEYIAEGRRSFEELLAEQAARQAAKKAA